MIYELWMRQHATIEVIRGQIRRLMADFGGGDANFGGRGQALSEFDPPTG